MSDNDAEFAKLMDELSNGSGEAAQVLLDRYGRYINRVVRRRLPDEIRPLFDSEDFVQSVWGSFFRTRPERDAFKSPGALARYLAGIANHKVITETRRRLMAEKHNINQVESLESAWHAAMQALSPLPSPSRVMMNREEKSALLKELPEYCREIIELRATGATFREIAVQLKMSERTVRRALKRLGNLSKALNDHASE